MKKYLIAFLLLWAFLVPSDAQFNGCQPGFCNVGLSSAAPTIYTGPLSTRNYVNDTAVSSTTGWNSRVPQYARDNITSGQLLLTNWRVNPGVGEVGSGGTLTVTASIEYPAGTVAAQVKFGGASSYVIPDLGQVLSDAVSVTIPKGALYFINVYRVPSVALLFSSSSQSRPQNLTLGEKVNNANVDYTMSPNSIIDSGGGSMIPVQGFFGPTLLPTIGAIGSSRMSGFKDTTDTTGDTGYTRFFGPSFGYLDYSTGGDKTVAVAGSGGALRRAIITQYCSHLWLDPGLNDLQNGGGTASSVLTALASMANPWPHGLFTVIMNDEAAWTNSTDGWITTANQTILSSGFETQRVLLTNGVDTTTGYNQIVKPAAFDGNGTNNQFWNNPVVGGFQFTPDGTHENHAALVAMVSAGLFNPALITRANVPLVVNQTGGTVTTNGAYTVITFTGSGSITANKSFPATVLALGGGGGGGSGGGGGGGAQTGTLQVPSSTTAVTIGAGGTGGTGSLSGAAATVGGNTVFSTFTAVGGGLGGIGGNAAAGSGNGGSGGTGGGGGANGNHSTVGGTGSQGGNGGGTSNTASPFPAGGGGGAGGNGNASPSSTVAGAGGVGLASSITGTATNYGGGGGGATFAGTGTVGAGGAGGGGAGALTGNGTNGTNGLGGGGGGASNGNTGGNGGGGVVIISYLTDQTQSSVASYLGNVATRTFLPSGKSTSNKQMDARNRHRATDNITSLQIVLPNWYVDAAEFGGGTFTELGSGQSPTITASIEYPVGTFTQVKFGGASSILPGDGATIVSDAVAITIPKGSYFFTRIFWTSSVGIIFTGINASTFIGSDTSVGEALAVAASGLSDLTMGGTITDSNTGFFTYRPVAIIAQTSIPSIFLAGDSRTMGVGDSTANASGDYGEAAPSLGAAGIGYVNVAIQGDKADKLISSHAKRSALAVYCSHVWSGYGINDIDIDGQTAAQLIANQQTIGGYNSGKPFFITTLSPHANVGNTAPANSSFNTIRISYNTMVRSSGISGVTNVWDIASVTEATLNGGLWTSGQSTDYLHANSTGTTAIKSSGVINTSLIHR